MSLNSSLLKSSITAASEQTVRDLRHGLDEMGIDLDEFVRDMVGLATTNDLFNLLAINDPEKICSFTARGNDYIIKPIADETNAHILQMKLNDKTGGKKKRGGRVGGGSNRGGFNNGTKYGTTGGFGRARPNPWGDGSRSNYSQNSYQQEQKSPAGNPDHIDGLKKILSATF